MSGLGLNVALMNRENEGKQRAVPLYSIAALVPGNTHTSGLQSLQPVPAA